MKKRTRDASAAGSRAGTVAARLAAKAQAAAAEHDASEQESDAVTPKIGDRVRVREGMAHDRMTDGVDGTVREISTPAIGITFDGMDGVHKWYVASELQSAEHEVEGDDDQMADEMGMAMGGGDAPVAERKTTDGTEEKVSPDALAAAQPKAFLAGVAEGVARERARITGILALASNVSGPRATRLVSAALEDGDETEASLAIALVREGAITASAAVAARAGDEAALDAPSGAAGQDLGDVGSTVAAIVALHNRNSKSRP